MTQTAAAAKSKVGRKSKGDRHAFMSRVPRTAADRVIAEADRLGVSYSEYIAYVLCRTHGVEPPHLSTSQDLQLPLATAS